MLCDGTTDDDVRASVDTAQRDGARIAGPAGALEALLPYLDLDVSEPLETRVDRSSVLIVAGSCHPVTQAQINHAESAGACVIHLARKGGILIPADPKPEIEVLQWIMAALNSIEMVTMPWVVLTWSDEEFAGITGWLDKRLAQIEAVLAEREWLVGDTFTAADLIMADVLRVDLVRKHGDRPASEAYVRRVTDRPAFRKAHADQLAHFAVADANREEKSDG